MKKFKYLWLCMLAGIMISTITSCKQDLDADWSGVSLYVLIENEEGQNLLDPNVEGNLVDKFQATAELDGTIYPLDWTLTKIPGFPDIFNESGQIKDVMVDGKYVDRWGPDNIPDIMSGFRYFIVHPESSRYPAHYFLCFGDFPSKGKWTKKIKISFPSRGKEYDIKWKNHDGKDNITVNGQSLPDYGDKFPAWQTYSTRVIVMTL